MENEKLGELVTCFSGPAFIVSITYWYNNRRTDDLPSTANTYVWCIVHDKHRFFQMANYRQQTDVFLRGIMHHNHQPARRRR